MAFEIKRINKEHEAWSGSRCNRHSPEFVQQSPLPLGNYINSGCYGSVYQSASHKSRVVKVCNITVDRAYWSFVRCLSKHKKSNPYLPKVFEAVVVKYETVEVLYIEMEKLFDIKNIKVDDLDEEHKDYWNSAELKEVDLILETVDWVTKSKKNTWCVTLYDTHLADAKKLIKKATRSADYAGQDLHGGNIMSRRNGQIVIIDPLS